MLVKKTRKFELPGSNALWVIAKNDMGGGHLPGQTGLNFNKINLSLMCGGGLFEQIVVKMKVA